MKKPSPITREEFLIATAIEAAAVAAVTAYSRNLNTREKELSRAGRCRIMAHITATTHLEELESMRHIIEVAYQSKKELLAKRKGRKKHG